MFEKIKNWFCGIFGGEDKKSIKRIAWNDSFELLNEKGTFELNDFTGHISFERTECEVEHATLTVVIGNTGYADGTVEYHAPWSRGVNRIVWHDGVVKSGDLCCHGFEKGVFNGGTLLVAKGSMKGEFNGKELHENLPF